ncbi:MAG: hypothetical protein GEU88_20780 [Solirubrobacterales bacterium]|nr:hypothetical protein [Solirubrobacterales bacterium]
MSAAANAPPPRAQRPLLLDAYRRRIEEVLGHVRSGARTDVAAAVAQVIDDLESVDAPTRWLEALRALLVAVRDGGDVDAAASAVRDLLAESQADVRSPSRRRAFFWRT